MLHFFWNTRFSVSQRNRNKALPPGFFEALCPLELLSVLISLPSFPFYESLIISIFLDVILHDLKALSVI